MVKLFNNKVSPGKINHKNTKKYCQRVSKGVKGKEGCQNESRVAKGDVRVSESLFTEYVAAARS